MTATPKKVLVVDDEPHVRRVLQVLLTDGQRRRCTTCGSAMEALVRLRAEPFDVVITDVCMPGMDGIALLDRIVRYDPHPSVIVMTGEQGADTEEDARRHGAYGLLRKPFEVERLRRLVDDAAKRIVERDEIAAPTDAPLELRTLWKFMPDPPPGQVERRSVTNALVRRSLKHIYLESVRALVAAVEAKDPHTEKHSVVVSYYCEVIARRMGLPPDEIETVKTAAILHDIGKIGIPDAILQRPGPLTQAEYAIVQQHPQRAADILGHASFLNAELPMIRHHHERFDGNGYPQQLAGEAIPLGARILAVADAIDTMLSRRSYKPSYDLDHVRSELQFGAGGQFDPRVTRVALEWLDASPGEIVVHPTEAQLV